MVGKDHVANIQTLWQFQYIKSNRILCFITFYETHGMNMASEKIHKK
jgi:hypothetical protein